MKPRFHIRDYKQADMNALPGHVRKTADLVKHKFLAESEGRAQELWWDVLHRLDAIEFSAVPDEDRSGPENTMPENRLSQAFLWDYSPEGWEYWSRVSRALNESAPISDAYEE
jgi:hypothetical protein